MTPRADLADHSDRELMALHTAGDPDAFGEIFRRHKDRMWAVAMRTCGDRELASDAVQDAFISAFRRSDSYRGDAAVTTWLHRIVVNACLDRLRRQRPTAQLPERDLGDGRDDTGNLETRLDVHAALAALPEAQRAALVLVDMHAVPVAEAAAILGVAEGTVKSRCSRGRAALAQLLRPGVEPRPAPMEPDGGR
ncbi:MAG: RNA polymerase sigma factor SigM [Tetrasphaera sp.]